MELFSLQYLLFLSVLLAVYYLVGRLRPAWQWCVLLVGTLVFYCSAGSWQTFGLVVGVTLVIWFFSRAFAKIDARCKAERSAVADRAQKKAIKARYVGIKRAVFWCGLVLCFAALFYLKYWNTILFNVGAAPTKSSLGLVLPLGMSFFTFQAVGYLIDSYNGKVEPEANFFRLLLFVSYFPQLIQGPINKFSSLAPQLYAPRRPDCEGMRRGLLRMGYGALKKFAIADILAVNVADLVGTVDWGTPGVLVVLGVLTYSIQMYADFSGGIEIVEGASELFGISMAQNFKQPYCAVSLADFWRRWHMTLGVWVRDYVFYPLALTKPMQSFGKWGTRRLGKHLGRTLPACVANVVTFLLVGLWHGAEWHYVAWGVYNGVIVALSDLLAPACKALTKRAGLDRRPGLHRGIAIVRTFLIVNVGRYFDCISDLGQTAAAFHNTIFNFMPVPLSEALYWADVHPAATLGFSVRVLAALAVVLVVDVLYERGHDVRARVLALATPVRLALYVACAILVIMSFSTVPETAGGFLYANF